MAQPDLAQRGGPFAAGPPFIYIYPLPNYRMAAPCLRAVLCCASLLPKDRSEQALAFGLFFSVGTLGNRCNLARLLAASAAHDLV